MSQRLIAITLIMVNLLPVTLVMADGEKDKQLPCVIIRFLCQIT